MSIRHLILSLGRSGSTSLTEAINCHPDARLLSEPFNKDFGKGGNIKTAKDVYESIRLMTQQGWTGLKHVFNTCAFNDEQVRQIILDQHPKVILLRRRNLLKHAVSMSMSGQSSIWHAKMQNDACQRIRAFDFEPLNLGYIELSIMSAKEMLEWSRSYMDDRRISYREIVYENLYGHDLSYAKRMRIFRRVLKSLGLDNNLSCLDEDKLKVIFSTDRKLNSEDTYRRVPNIDEIEQRFGSQENGFLFR